MIRGVLDTNVWISAVALEGTLTVMVDLLDAQQFEALTSREILDEFARVLREKFKRPANLAEEYRQVVREYATLVAPRRRISLLKHDPDNRVLECAVEAGADYIVTGDRKHLLPLKEFRGIEIVSPAEFLELIKRTST